MVDATDVDKVEALFKQQNLPAHSMVSFSANLNLNALAEAGMCIYSFIL